MHCGNSLKVFWYALFSYNHIYFLLNNHICRAQYFTGKFECLAEVKPMNTFGDAHTNHAELDEIWISSLVFNEFYSWIKRRQIIFLTRSANQPSTAFARRITEKPDGTYKISDRIPFVLPDKGCKNTTYICQLRNNLIFYYKLPNKELILDLLCLRSLKFIARYDHGLLDRSDFWLKNPPVLRFRRVEYFFINWGQVGPKNNRQNKSNFVAVCRHTFHPMRIATSFDLVTYRPFGRYAMLKASSMMVVVKNRCSDDHHFIRLSFAV